jgi:hypothetical protein
VLLDDNSSDQHLPLRHGYSQLSLVSDCSPAFGGPPEETLGRDVGVND